MPAPKLFHEVQFACQQDGRVAILKVPFRLMTKLIAVDEFQLGKRNKHYVFSLKGRTVSIKPRLREDDSTIPGWVASSGSKTLYFSVKLFMRREGLDADTLDGQIFDAKILVNKKTGRRRLVFDLPRKAFRKVA